LWQNPILGLIILNSLIQYRIQQAKDTALEVDFLIDNNKLKNASNRIYCSMFYIVSALALLYKFNTSKHQQLIGWGYPHKVGRVKYKTL